MLPPNYGIISLGRNSKKIKIEKWYNIFIGYILKALALWVLFVVLVTVNQWLFLCSETGMFFTHIF